MRRTILTLRDRGVVGSGSAHRILHQYATLDCGHQLLVEPFFRIGSTIACWTCEQEGRPTHPRRSWERTDIRLR